MRSNMKFKRYFVEDIPRRKFLKVSLKGGIALAATPALLSQLLSCKATKPGTTKVVMDPQFSASAREEG
jgi:TldD protein